MPDIHIPHDSDAEQFILANCLLSESVNPLADLGEQHFYSTDNRRIFTALRSLADAKTPVNLVEVARWLQGHGNSVSPGYVAALPDGIPELTPVTLEYYKGRLNESLSQREMQREAASLNDRAASGRASAEEIRESAQRIADKAAPKADKKKDKAIYPELPEQVWHGMAKLYRQALTHAVEASDNYLFASFLVLAGSVLGRTVFTRKGRILYPNLYVILVGDSADARKGTAIGCALDFYWERDTGVYLTSVIKSEQGLTVDLQQGQRELREKGFGGELRCVLWLDEFRSFLETAEQKGTKGVVPTLCTLYDCPPSLDNKVVNKESKATVEKPTLSIISGTSQDFLEGLTVKDIKGGLGNRLCFVPGDPKPRNWNVPDPDYSILIPLYDQLLEVARFWRERGITRFYLSAEADAYCKKFYEKEFNPLQVDELIRVLSNRDPSTLLKVALIFAALDKSVSKLLDGRDAETGKIEIWHVQAARAFVQFLYDSRFPIFSGHGASPTVQAQQRLAKIVQDRKQVSAESVLKLMSRYGDATLVWRLADGLQRADMLEIRPIGNRKFLIWKGEQS